MTHNSNISTENIAQAFAQNFSTYESEAVAQKQIVEQIFRLLQENNNEHNRILEIGCGTGLLSKKLLHHFSDNEIFFNDLVQDDFFTEAQKNNFLKGNAEIIDFPNSLDIIISSSAIQWFQNIPMFFKKVCNASQF